MASPPYFAHLGYAPANGDDWLGELEFDGYRIITVVKAGKIALWIRNRKRLIDKYLMIADRPSELEVAKSDFDGELVPVDGGGKAAFASMQAPAEDLSVYPEHNLFDLLNLDDRHLRRLAARGPQGHLKTHLALPFDGLKFSDHLRRYGKQAPSAACRLGLESAISSWADAAYLPGRFLHWLKAKYVGIDDFYQITKVGPLFASRQVGERSGSRLGCHARRNQLGGRKNFDAEA